MVFSGDLLKETYSKFKPEYTCWFDKSTWKYLDKYQVLCLQVQVSTKYFWISKCQVQVSTKYSRFCIKYQVSSTSTLLDPNPDHRSHTHWVLPEETKCVFPSYWWKTKWISEFRRTNPQELKCWSTFCVDYFLRYYLMMQHQPIVKRVNGTHEWAHRPYQLLSAPYHCCLYKHRRQDERQPPQSSWPVPICS